MRTKGLLTASREARWPWSGFSEQHERRPEKMFHSSPTSSLVSPVVVRQELPKTSLRGWGTHPTWHETCRASPPPHPHLKQQLPLLLPPTLTPYSSWGIFYFFNIWNNFNYHFSCITQVWHPRKKTYSSYIISTSGLWIKWLPCNLY